VSLLEEFKSKTTDYSYPHHWDVAKELGAVQVAYNIEDTTRWGQVVSYVYQRKNEYVKVVYEEGSGDSDIDYDPEIFEVRPYSVTVTEYHKP